MNLAHNAEPLTIIRQINMSLSISEFYRSIQRDLWGLLRAVRETTFFTIYEEMCSSGVGAILKQYLDSRGCAYSIFSAYKFKKASINSMFFTSDANAQICLKTLKSFGFSGMCGNHKKCPFLSFAYISHYIFAEITHIPDIYTRQFILSEIS